LRLVEVVKKMGFDGLEIAMFDPAELPVADIRDAFKANDLECTVCGILPEGINPISPEVAVRKKAVEHLLRCVETCLELKATLLCGPLYAPIGYLPSHRPTKQEWAWAVEAFVAVCESLRSDKLTIAIEPVNRSETFFLRTAKEAKAFCEAIGHDNVGVTIDTFHSNIEEQNIARAIGSLGSSLRHIHMSENDRGLLGAGHVGFKEILNVLKQSGYRGFLMIEGFGYSPEENDGPGVLWADMCVSPEQLAKSGASYLRGLLDI
jgi:D-psicose/D-tagatose/L-ribulose 3-epimerase